MSDQITGQSHTDILLKVLGLTKQAVDSLNNPIVEPPPPAKPNTLDQFKSKILIISLAIGGYYGFKWLKKKRYI